MADRKSKSVLKSSAKRARVFVIRKITRSIKTYRAKKGTTQQVEKNARKVERLIQDIQYLKGLDLNLFCEELVDRLQGSDTSQLYSDDERLKQRMVCTSVLRTALQSVQSKMADEPQRVISDSDVEEDRLLGSREPVQEQDTPRKPVAKRKHRQTQSTAQSKPKNRMGQRSRRRLAEEKYGDNAKHKEVKKSMSKSKTVTKSKPGGPPATPKLSGGVSRSSAQHPSWEAARKAHLAESTARFSGKRAVFSDSD